MTLMSSLLALTIFWVRSKICKWFALSMSRWFLWPLHRSCSIVSSLHFFALVWFCLKLWIFKENISKSTNKKFPVIQKILNVIILLTSATSFCRAKHVSHSFRKPFKLHKRSVMPRISFICLSFDSFVINSKSYSISDHKLLSFSELIDSLALVMMTSSLWRGSVVFVQS